MQLDLFWRWIWVNYKDETVEAFADNKRAEWITRSVTTNPARAREKNTHEKTIARVYYEVCFSRRGPYGRENVQTLNELRELHKRVEMQYHEWADLCRFVDNIDLKL